MFTQTALICAISLLSAAPAPSQISPPAQGAVNGADYVLGSGDQIAVHAVDVEEIDDKPILVDTSGYVRLPLAGRIRVSGLTVAQVETEIADRLKTYLLHPDVSVSIADLRSQPVSVIGAVKNAGVVQIQGKKTLLEVLSLAGGLDATAGSTLFITRRHAWERIPLPGVVDDETGQFSIAQINLEALLHGKDPAGNISIKPYDVVSVPRADTIYVIGEVQKAGNFLLNDHKDVTVLQALSMAGGLNQMAQPRNAKILRRVPGTTTQSEIPVDLRKILSGKDSDIRMQAEDVLFVPNNVSKRAAVRALEAAIQMGTGVVIWHR